MSTVLFRVILSTIALFVLIGTCIDIYNRWTDGENVGKPIVKTTGSNNTDPPSYDRLDEDPGSQSDRTVLVEHDGLDPSLISQGAFQDRSMEISQETTSIFARVAGKDSNQNL